MKKQITTLFVALLVAGSAFAQQTRSQMNAGGERKLLSSCTQGDYTVNRYLVKDSSSDNDEFSVRYKINAARLVSTYDNNSDEIKGLHSFIEELQKDTLKKITSVNIKGFASPDGSTAINERLALERAQDFRQYINKNCGMSSYSGTTAGHALGWKETSDAVSSSSIPNKSMVLELVNSNQTAAIVESKLKGISDSWSYMKVAILPPMRCVELCVKYNSWRVVETRTLNRSCSTPTSTAKYFILIEDDPEGMIVNPTDVPLDYDNAKYKDKFKMNRHREKLKAKERAGRERGYYYQKERLSRKQRRYRRY